MPMSRIAYIVIGIIILALLAFFSISYYYKAQVQIPGYNLVLQLTDPPYVPNGMQSLNITYSSIQVHILGVNVSKWVQVNETGTVDLLKILNLTKTIGTVVVPMNSLVDQIKFNITSANITVNNTSYGVTLPNKQISVHISGRSMVNGTSILLLDLSPTVVTILTSNTTIFVLVPSVRAIIVPKIGLTVNVTHIGAVAKINESMLERLEETRPNITITSAILSTVNSITQVSITVKNNANRSVELRNILVYGNETMNVKLNFTPDRRDNPEVMPDYGTYVGNLINTTLGKFANGSLPQFRLNISEVNNFWVHTKEVEHINASGFENIFGNVIGNRTLITNLHINDTEAENAFNSIRIAGWLEIEQEHFRVLNFLIERNGTLILPFSEHDLEVVRYGYNLTPSNSITLTFSGKMSLANGRVSLNFKPGSSYKVIVIGEEGARAKANVTAS
jgi:hypothetical protein